MSRHATVTQEGVAPRQPDMCVSVTSGSGRNVLNVSRCYTGLTNGIGGRGRFKPCDCDGFEFASAEAAFAFALERGYLRRFHYRSVRSVRL